MSKFVINLDQNSISNQIASLINSNNKLKQHYTPSLVMSNAVTYCLELGGYNERFSDKKRLITGVVGCSLLSREVTLIRHLCVHDQYRNRGLATSLLKQAIANCSTKIIQIRVRNDNVPCLNLTERLGFKYIYHETMNNYHVLVLGREIGGY